MDDPASLGQTKVIDGRLRVHYLGYWIRAYEAPVDTLAAKKRLIEALTRRLFNHCEHGINIPGRRLDEARAAYEAEADPARRRVKAAMLAGALFNRATDVFTKLVELEEIGVHIDGDNALMRECGGYLEQALELGKSVLHRSGEEGLDELWGEPFKAFAYPIDAFYKSRYMKIAMSMQAIDAIRDELLAALARNPAFDGLEPRIVELARAGRVKCETLRTDNDIFEVWTSFVVACEEVERFEPHLPPAATRADEQLASDGRQLLVEAKNVISYMVRARVPMPKTTANLVERCRSYGERARQDPVRSVA